MKFYKFIGAIGNEKNVAKISSNLQNISSTYKVVGPKFAITQTSGSLKLGGKNISEIKNLLKLGKVQEATKHIFGLESLPKFLEIQLLKEVKHLPSFKVGKVEKGVDLIKDNLKNSPSFEKISNKKWSGKVTEKMLLKDSKLKAICVFLKNKTFKSLTFGTIVFSGSLVAICETINNHREKLSGCFQYKYENNGQISVCKIAACSCNNGRPALTTTNNVNFCHVKNIPESMSNINNCHGTLGIQCVKCPDDEIITKSFENLDDKISLERENENDTIYYKCHESSFLDAVGDIVNDKVEFLNSSITNVINETGNLFSTFFVVFKFIIISFGFIVVFYSFFYIKNKTESKNIPRKKN